MATLTPGMSAKQLQRQLGCRYQTAWFVLHRLRRGMVSDTRSRLAGRVEADAVIVGGPVRGKRGRGVTRAVHSTLVFGAVEVITYTGKQGAEVEKAGRLRLALTQRADAVSFVTFCSRAWHPAVRFTPMAGGAIPKPRWQATGMGCSPPTRMPCIFTVRSET